jgi:hypothetical protein
MPCAPGASSKATTAATAFQVGDATALVGEGGEHGTRIDRPHGGPVECIAVAFESGRSRLTSLRSDLWAASICLPDPATAIRFDRGTVQVADNGSRKGHWPAIHEFTLHFPSSNERRLPK